MKKPTKAAEKAVAAPTQSTTRVLAKKKGTTRDTDFVAATHVEAEVKSKEGKEDPDGSADGGADAAAELELEFEAIVEARPAEAAQNTAGAEVQAVADEATAGVLLCDGVLLKDPDGSAGGGADDGTTSGAVPHVEADATDGSQTSGQRRGEGAGASV